MKQKYYMTKGKIYCGPCSFINLVGLKGNLKLEKYLSSIGRKKPFFANDYTSFLIWGEKYKKNLKIYVSSKALNDKMLNFMIKYEKVPKDKIKKYKLEAKRIHKKRNEKFKNQIKIMKNPIKKLNLYLSKNCKVAVLISDYYFHPKKRPCPHWIVALKKHGNRYYFIDSSKGIISLTKKQLEKGFNINKKYGFYPELIILCDKNAK